MDVSLYTMAKIRAVCNDVGIINTAIDKRVVIGLAAHCSLALIDIALKRNTLTKDCNLNHRFASVL